MRTRLTVIVSETRLDTIFSIVAAVVFVLLCCGPAYAEQGDAPPRPKVAVGHGVGAAADSIGSARGGLSTAAEEQSTDCLARGDCDGDGTPLTVADMLFLLRVLVHETPPATPFYECNLNGDAQVDIMDVFLLMSYFTNGFSAFDYYGGYPVYTSCTVGMTTEALIGFSESDATFRVMGGSDGAGWSWAVICLDDPFSSCFDYEVEPVAAGGSAADLANRWVESINNACGSISARADGSLITLSAELGSHFALAIGEYGREPFCRMPLVGVCPFNPDLVYVPLSGADCNGNSVDDAIDIAVETSTDINGNGVPDECEAPVVTIEKTHNTHQGTEVDVSITLEDWPLEMGGFDFLIAYDASALSFLKAEEGQLLEDCGWEYFTYRHGVEGNCGDACPSGLLRIIAMADLDNGPANHPSCYGPPDTDPHELATMKFHVTEDLTFEGQYIPITFYWSDCGDNAVSSIDGNITYLDAAIHHFTGTLLWDENNDTEYPEDARPQGLGAPDICLEGSGPDKPEPVRLIDYWFGGIDIIPRDSLDEPGDINLNGIYNEVADAVLFSNYFIYGDAVWDPPYREGQIAATDVNMDGITLTIADLVYLIRIITGDETPFPKVGPRDLTASVDWRIEGDELVVDWTSQIDAGAVLLAFDHHGAVFGDPMLGTSASGMKLIAHDDGKQMRVLIHGMERGDRIASGQGTILRVPMVTADPEMILGEAEAADYWGHMMPVTIARPATVPRSFALFQNVPNPFNASTQIAFDLPEAGDVTLAVFDVLGRRVATLVNDHLDAGAHRIVWDARDQNGRALASGVYFYRITTTGSQASRKMVLLK